MKAEQEQFLRLPTPPARVTVTEAAWILGFSAHDIPILVAAGLLKPLGHPPANGTKFFASLHLEELRRDVKWLVKASDAIVNHWKAKNGRRSDRVGQLHQNDDSGKGRNGYFDGSSC